MSELFYVSSFFFFVWMVRNVLFWTHLWQLKEYRFDRVFIHLKETTQGQQLLFSFFSLTKFAAILVYPLVVFNPTLTGAYHFFITVMYGVLAYRVFQEIYLRILKRPILTVKAGFILVSVLSISFLLFFIPLIDEFVWLLFLDKLMPFLAAFVVFFLAFPTELYRDWVIERAGRRIRNHKKLLVIGITGSYGKSSTKDYIAQILSAKYSVVKTLGTNNTPIGIANTILSSLKDSTDIFVVEMGAYRKGEVAEMCDIVHPKIGVLTAVNAQHASLFGSIENTKIAKYELIEALPKDGLALFNGNNKNVYQLYKKTKKPKILYFTRDARNNHGIYLKEGDKTVEAYSITVQEESISFEVYMGGKVVHFMAPLIGGYNIENILPAIHIAEYLGMDEKDIKRAVSQLIQLPKTMNYHMLESGAVVINDTFNANPQAILAALDYIRIYPGKKIFVLQPMIELGREAQNEHRKIGEQIAGVCDYLFLTNKNFYSSIVQGAQKHGNCIVQVSGPYQLEQLIRTTLRKGDVAVFEGKESAFSFSRIA